MGWDRHKLLWDRTDKYVPWTTLPIAQARNQFGAPGEAKSLWEGPNFLNYVKFFKTMSNTFFQRGRKNFQGDYAPPLLTGLL